VRCNACQHENREGRKFCASCGSALAILCRECGFANEAGERFCGGCGCPLATADALASESKPVAEPEGDRRPVTVLFCDLVGYTRLSSMLDPEDVHALLQRFFALVDASVDRFGGTIRRFEAMILGNCVEIALGRGLKAEALAYARTGLDISEETGPGFVGPIIFALLALVEDRREDQEAALAAGEALLEQGSVGHNQFGFRRYAIERALLLEDWNQAERHADALLVRMANEPLVLSSWVAQRGKILARYGRSEATDADEDEFKRILEAAADAAFRIDAFSESLRQI
jgi:hypothetical protein